MISLYTSSSSCENYSQNDVKEMEDAVKGIAKQNEEAKLLITIPGIGYYSALLIVSEICLYYKTRLNVAGVDTYGSNW